MPDSESVVLLRSIDASLKELVAISKARRAPAQTAARGPEVASDKDLDDPKWGNPVVKFVPRDWSGEDFKGSRFSETSAEFLEVLAETFDYFAQKAEEKNELYNGKPVAPYKRKDAARARGWAQRLRSGWKPAEPFQAQEEVKW